jgi:hypothetical protein
MVRKIVRVNILSNERLLVPFGNTIGKIDQHKKKIELGFGARVEGAVLEIAATQTYLSGADITVSMNKTELRPPLMWNAFETDTKRKEYPVATEFGSGVNTFTVLYRTAFGALSDQVASITMVLVLTLVVPEATSPGVEVGGTDDVSESLKDKVAKGIKDTSSILIGLAVVGVVSWAGFSVYKGGHFDRFKS